MAQGPRLLSVGGPAAVTPDDGLSCSSSLTCRSSIRYHSPDAAGANLTARQPRYRDVVPESTVVLHSVCCGALISAEKVVDRVHCADLPTKETSERLLSGRDACRPQVATKGLATRRLSITGGPRTDTEAGWRQGASPCLTERAAFEPTDLLMSGRRRRCETTGAADSTEATEPLSQWETNHVKKGTVSVCTSPATAEAAVDGLKVSDACPPRPRLSPAHEIRVCSRQCTMLPAGSSTVLGVRESVAVAAAVECTVNADVPVSVLDAACAGTSTGAKAAVGDNICVASPTGRTLAFNGAGPTGAVELELPHAAMPVAAANVDSPLAIPRAARAVAAGTNSTAAALNAAAAAQSTGGAHVTPALYGGGERICQRLPPRLHFLKNNVHKRSNDSAGSGSPGNRRIDCNAEHTKACTQSVIFSSAKHSSCPTGINNKAVGNGDTADPSTWHANVKPIRVDPLLRDAKVSSGSGTAPDILSGIATLGLCGGEEVLYSKRKRPANNASGTNRNKYSSSGTSSCSFDSSNMHDGSSVNGGVRGNVNDKDDTSSICRCNGNAHCNNRCGSHGGSRIVHGSICPFTSRVDSCRSTTVSTPSPAASSTSRSVRSISYERDASCCMIEGYTSCDSCSGHGSCENGTTCKGIGAFESEASFMEWSEVSPAALLKRACPCRPSPTLSCSCSMLQATNPATIRCSVTCMHNGEHKVLAAPHMPNVTETARVNWATPQLTAAHATTEMHHRFYVAHKDAQMHPRPPPVEELLLPAAVVPPGDALFRAQQQRHLPRSPALLLASHPLENALLQAAASATPTPAANRNGSGAWFCGSSSPWGSSSSSTCSPSVFSQLPIVPLSAWPVPATYVCEDGVALAETEMQRDSPDTVECSPCGRQCAELISCHSWSGDFKFEETVLQPAHFDDRREDLLDRCKSIAQESRRQRRGRQLHSQPFTSFLSGTADLCRAELVSPGMVKRPTRHTRSPPQVFGAMSAAEEATVAAFPGKDKADALHPRTTTATSPSACHLQLPFRSHAESWFLLHIACASRASTSSRATQDHAPGVGGFCSSTLRTATLLLGDHDPESISASGFNICDSTNSAGSPISTSCDVKASGEENCSSRSGCDPLCTLEARRRHDNLQRVQAPQRLVSAEGPGSVVSSGVAAQIGALRLNAETPSLPNVTSCRASAGQVVTADPHDRRAASAVSCSVIHTLGSAESPALELAAEVASSFLRSASNADEIADCSTAETTAQCNCRTAFPQPGLECSARQSCMEQRLLTSKEEEGMQGQGRQDQQQEDKRHALQQQKENEVLKLQEGHRYKQQEWESENTDALRNVMARENAQSTACGEQAGLTAALNEGALFNGSATLAAQSGGATATKETSAAASHVTGTEFSTSGQRTRPSSAEPSLLMVSSANPGDIRLGTLAVHSQCRKVSSKGMHDIGSCHPASSEALEEGEAATTAETSGSTTAAPPARAAVLCTTTAGREVEFGESLMIHAARANCSRDNRTSSLAGSSGLTLATYMNGEAFSGGTAMESRQERLVGTVAYEEKQSQVLQDCVINNAVMLAQRTPLLRHRREDKRQMICTNSEIRHKSTTLFNSRRCSRSSSRGSVSSTSTQSGLPSYWTSRSSSTRCSPLSSRRRESLAASAAAADAGLPTSATADICVSAANLLSSIPARKVMSSQHTEVHQISKTSHPQVVRQYSREASAVASASDDPRRSVSAAVQWGVSAPTGGLLAEVALGAAAPLSSVQEPLRPSMVAALCHIGSSPFDSVAAATPSSPAFAGVASVFPTPEKAATASSMAIETADAAAAARKDDSHFQRAQNPDWSYMLCGTDGVPAKGSAVGENRTAAPNPQAEEAAVKLVAATARANEVGERSRKAATEERSSDLPTAASRLRSCASESDAPAALEPLNLLSCRNATNQQQFGAPHLLLTANKLAAAEVNITTAAGAATTHRSSLLNSDARASTVPADITQEPGAVEVVLNTASITQCEPQGVRLTSWSRQDNFEHAQRRETQKVLPVAAESAAISAVYSNGSSSGVKHPESPQFPSQHFQQATPDVEVFQPRSQVPQGEPSVQQHQHQQLQQQQTQSHKQHHLLRQRLCQELVDPVEECVYHEKSLNTPRNPPGYLISLADSCSRQNSSEKGPGLRNSREQEDNSHNPECTALESEMPGALFVAQAAFVSRSTSEHADSLGYSSGSMPTTSNCGTTQSPPLNRGWCEGKIAVITGSKGQLDIKPVKDSNCTLSGSAQPCYTFGASSVQTLTVKTAPVMSCYSKTIALASRTGYSCQDRSSWKLPERPFSSLESPQATSANVRVATATGPNDFEVLPGPLMKVAENKQMQHQLREAELQINCASSHFELSESRTSQGPISKSMLDGLQGPAAAAAAAKETSGKWLSNIASMQIDLGAREPREGEGVTYFNGENELFTEATQSSRRPGPLIWNSRQDDSADRATSFNSDSALHNQAADEGGNAAAAVMASEEGALYGRPHNSDATEAPPAYGVVAALPPAGAHCVAGDTDGAAARPSCIIAEKLEADVETFATANDEGDGGKEPEREDLITMSDSRWIALRRSGLFRLGDKGRASIKSRIAKQLRLCPELRRAAAAIGGGGVRCATTKQLYQLAELCGFDDVLPPEFRRPRSGAEHQGVTSAAEEGRAVTRLGTTDDTCYGTSEKSGSRFCSSATHSTASSSKRSAASSGDAAANSNGSAALDIAILCESSPGANNVKKQGTGRYDNISGCGRLLKPSPSTHPEYTAGNVDSFQSACISEEWQQQQQPQQLQQPQTIAHDFPESKLRKSRQQTKRRSSAAATKTWAAQHDTPTWPLLVMHQWQGPLLPTDYQQHHVHQLQHQQQPSLQHQCQPYSSQHPLQHQERSHPQPQHHCNRASKQQVRYQQEQLHHLQQLQPQQHELEHHRARLPVVPHAARDSIEFSKACGNARVCQGTTPVQLVQQQHFPPQTQQETEQPRDLAGNRQHQHQWLQRGHLSQQASTPHPQDMLHHVCIPESLEISQTAAQPQSTQNQTCLSNLHTYADVAAPHAAIPLNGFTQSATSATSGCQARLGVESASASENPSAAGTGANATAHSSVFRLPPAAGSINANSCTASGNDHSGRHSISCSSDSSSKWLCKESTGHSDSRLRETEPPAISNFDTEYPLEQGCHLDSLSGRRADQQLQRDQQEYTRQRLPRLEVPTVHGRTPLNTGPSGVPDSIVASSDKASAAHSVSAARSTSAPHSVSAGHSVSATVIEKGVPPGASSGIVVAGPATEVVTSLRQHELLHREYRETANHPAEAALPPAIGPSPFTRKVCALQQLPCLSLLSQSTQSSSPPGSSPQAWGENGTNTTLTCGSCSTKSSRSCLAEDARAMKVAPQEETSSRAFANVVGTPALHSPSDGKPGLLSGDTFTPTTAGAAAGKCCSLATSEQLRSRRREIEARTRREQEFTQAGLPRKRCRTEAADNAACQQCNAVDQHQSGEQCLLDKCDSAQQPYQPNEESGSVYPQEGCQQPIVLRQVSRREQLQKDILVPNMQEGGVTQPQQERLQQHSADGPQVCQQLLWKGGSPCPPSCVSRLSDRVGASRYDSTMNELLHVPGWKSASRSNAGQLRQYAFEPHPRNFSPVNNMQRQERDGTSAPCWQEVSCSSADSPSCGTSDLYSDSNGGASSSWISTVDTRVVDELFETQSNFEVNSPSDRIHLDHDDGNLVKKGSGTS